MLYPCSARLLEWRQHALSLNQIWDSKQAVWQKCGSVAGDESSWVGSGCTGRSGRHAGSGCPAAAAVAPYGRTRAWHKAVRAPRTAGWWRLKELLSEKLSLLFSLFSSSPASASLSPPSPAFASLSPMRMLNLSMASCRGETNRALFRRHLAGGGETDGNS